MTGTLKTCSISEINAGGSGDDDALNAQAQELRFVLVALLVELDADLVDDLVAAPFADL